MINQTEKVKVSSIQH